MLRIATYNIRKCVGLDWRRRPERVVEVLHELRADVVAVQEADRRFGARLPTLPLAHLAHRAGLVPVEVESSLAGSGHHGNAILVGEGVTVTGTATIDLPSFEPRGAIVAELMVRGTPATIVGVHLGLRAADRLRQAKAILAAINQSGDARRTIILGDTNAWSARSPAMATLSSSFQPSKPLKSFHSAMPVAPFDRLFLGENFRFRRIFVHRSANADVASDHLPVCAEVDLVGLPAGNDGATQLEGAEPSNTSRS